MNDVVDKFPQLRIAVKAIGTAVTVDVAGELDVAVERQFVDAISNELGAGRTRVTVDLTRVTFIDSAGLRGLIHCLTVAQRSGVALELSVRHGPVTRLLDTSGTSDLFTYAVDGHDDATGR